MESVVFGCYFSRFFLVLCVSISFQHRVFQKFLFMSCPLISTFKAAYFSTLGSKKKACFLDSLYTNDATGAQIFNLYRAWEKEKRIKR